MTERITTKLVAAICLIALAGCVHAISKDIRGSADKGVSVEALFKDTDSYKGKTVVLGGVIISTANSADGTYIEVLERPLDFVGKPRDVDTSRGRFIIAVEGFLDAAIYHPGRLVTVGGEVLGKETRPLGEMQYAYLLIKSRELYLHRPMPEPPIRFSIGIFQTF